MMTVKEKKNLFAAFTCMALSAAAVADITLTGETEYAVESGSTNSVAERITGFGSILKTGGGDLSLSGIGNDFSGGVAVSEGTVSVASENALGTGAVTVSDVSACVNFKVAPASSDGYVTFDNPFSFTGDAGVGYGSVAYGNGDGKNNVVFFENTRLSGDVTGTRSFRLRHNPVNIGSPGNGGPSTVFEGKLDVGDVYLNLYGTMTANGPITASLVSGGDAWSGGGTLALNNPANSISRIVICHNKVRCGAANVLGGAVLIWRLTGVGPTPGFAHVDMAGLDQTVSGLSQYVFGSDSRWDMACVSGFVGKNDNTYCVTSSKDATLTIIGGAEDLTTYAPLRGAMSLVLDAKDFSSFRQTFEHNDSNFRGKTEICAGTIEIKGKARFSGTRSVTVASGAAFLCNSTNAQPALASVRELTVNGSFDASQASVNPFTSALETVTIGENASLSLPEGSGLRVKSLTVNGRTYAIGCFTPETLPSLKGGSIVVSGGEASHVAWTGAKSASLADAGNWDDPQVDLKYGTFAAVFAKSGAAATVDSDVAVHEMLFRAADGEAGFTLSRSEPAHPIAVGPRISALTNDAAATAHTYVIDNPIRVLAQLTFHADTNQTLVIRNALNETSDEMGAHSIFVDGRGQAANATGSVRFEGTNYFGGSITVTASLVRVSGLLSNPDGVYTGKPGDDSLDSIVLNLNQGGLVNDTIFVNNGLWLDNATVKKSMLVKSAIGRRSITTAPNTTNEFAGYLRYSLKEHQGVEVNSGSELILSGGLYGSHSFRKYGPGTLRVRNVPVDCQESAGFNPSGPGRIIFEVPNNTFNYLCLGYGPYNSGDMVVETAVDHVITNGIVQIGGDGGSVGSCVANSGGKSYRLDLHSTTQRCRKLAVLKKGELAGEYPAMMEIFEGWLEGDPEGYRYVSGKITGGVGLHQCGEGTLSVTNAVASCGDLAVSAGTLEFAGEGTWLNGTNVTVKGSGTLRLVNGTHFSGKNAVLHLGADGDAWQIDIPAGASQGFAAAYDHEGNRLSAGTYGNASSGASFTRYASHFPNGGKISVRPTGLALSVR